LQTTGRPTVDRAALRMTTLAWCVTVPAPDSLLSSSIAPCLTLLAQNRGTRICACFSVFLKFSCARYEVVHLHSSSLPSPDRIRVLPFPPPFTTPDFRPKQRKAVCGLCLHSVRGSPFLLSFCKEPVNAVRSVAALAYKMSKSLPCYNSAPPAILYSQCSRHTENGQLSLTNRTEKPYPLPLPALHRLLPV
jgi:hypothetical protein